MTGSRGAAATGRRPGASRRGPLALLALVALVVVALATAAALARPPGGPDGVTAVDARSGRPLPPRPVLPPGARVVVTVSGFAPAAPVTVGLVGVRLFGTVAADARGRVTYPYSVPRGLPGGLHSLIFSGAPRPAGPSRGTGGSLDVRAPLTRTWPFRTPGRPVPGGGTSAGASAGHGVGGEPGSGSEPATAGSGPAATGTDVRTALGVGVLTLVAGATLLAAARRRSLRAKR